MWHALLSDGGNTLALDFPADSTNLALLTELDAIVAAHGGRICLAKDACVAAADFGRGYDDLAAFGAVRAAVDPGGKFASPQWQGLSL